MDFVLGYFAGLLTLINPCVLPILPVVLVSAMQAGRAGPLMLAAGMSVSFVALGLFVASAGRAFGVTEEAVSSAAAALMIAFGLVLLIPRFSESFATATGGMAARADSQIDDLETESLSGQFVGGMLLGAVWSPCIGPTLGAAIGLASQGGSLWVAGGTMAAFALGVSTIILALGYGAQSAIRRRQSMLRRIAAASRPVTGLVFVAVGFAILFKLHHVVEIWALENLPVWIVDFSVSI